MASKFFIEGLLLRTPSNSRISVLPFLLVKICAFISIIDWSPQKSLVRIFKAKNNYSGRVDFVSKESFALRGVNSFFVEKYSLLTVSSIKDSKRHFQRTALKNARIFSADFFPGKLSRALERSTSSG